MFEANVLSGQRLVASLLPLLREAANAAGHADLLFVTSTAAQTAYPGGGGYNAAKAGESMLVHALRQGAAQFSAQDRGRVASDAGRPGRS